MLYTDPKSALDLILDLSAMANHRSQRAPRRRASSVGLRLAEGLEGSSRHVDAPMLAQPTLR
jgi:hypothetical protein